MKCPDNVIVTTIPIHPRVKDTPNYDTTQQGPHEFLAANNTANVVEVYCKYCLRKQRLV